MDRRSQLEDELMALDKRRDKLDHDRYLSRRMDLIEQLRKTIPADEMPDSVKAFNTFDNDGNPRKPAEPQHTGPAWLKPLKDWIKE